ncbi:MAG: glycine cleavage system protein GcvH [Deltaproteobacteria bacterium]|nr:glycine cleavage system protein GcvH [Deltaproteobacteria bacterium]
MSYPEELFYTQEHEWLGLNGDIATLGITHYAQEQLGDIVFVELPAVGAKFQAGDSLGVVESTKSVSDIFIPIAGTVIEVNDPVVEEPSLVNEDAYGEGWLVKIKMDNPKSASKLMTSEQYQAFLEERS